MNLFEPNPIALAEFERKLNVDCAIISTDENVKKMGENIRNIEADVSDIDDEIKKLNYRIKVLEKGLKEEKERAEKAEKDESRRSFLFDIFFTVLSVVLGILLQYLFDLVH